MIFDRFLFLCWAQKMYLISFVPYSISIEVIKLNIRKKILSILNNACAQMLIRTTLLLSDTSPFFPHLFILFLHIFLLNSSYQPQLYNRTKLISLPCIPILILILFQPFTTVFVVHVVYSILTNTCCEEKETKLQFNVRITILYLWTNT